MIERFQILKNIGQFDNVVAAPPLASLTRLSLIYGENGRGKTTLAAILKSASTGDPAGIIERKRLGALADPEVVITLAGANRTFQNGGWSAPSPELVVFDDAFVAANVCSGIAIDVEHRQNLHELILGAQGVALNQTLLAHIARIEELNRAIRQRENNIPAAMRGTLSVEQFCALPNEADITNKIADAERALAAARNAQAIAARGPLLAPSLPPVDINEINAILGKSLPDIQAEAMARVREHLAELGKKGEEWIGEGMAYLPAVQGDDGSELCPFCKQDLAASPIL